MAESRKCALAECEERLGKTYRSHAKYCSAICRAEASRRRRSLHASGKRTEAHSSDGTRRKRGSGKRPDTHYVVEVAIGDLWAPVGQTTAHDREAAIRELASDSSLLYRALPARSTRPHRSDGSRI